MLRKQIESIKKKIIFSPNKKGREKNRVKKKKERGKWWKIDKMIIKMIDAGSCIETNGISALVTTH